MSDKLLLQWFLCNVTFLCDLKINFRTKYYINRLSKTNVFMSEKLLNTYKPEMTNTV